MASNHAGNGEKLISNSCTSRLIAIWALKLQEQRNLAKGEEGQRSCGRQQWDKVRGQDVLCAVVQH